MKIGCINKQTNITEYIYIYDRFKKLPKPYGSDDYVQYEILDKVSKYIWDEGTQSVIIDPNYVEPEIDYVSIGKKIVRDAIEFGQELVIDFAGENVALGITQAGKTKEVADYLEDVQRYISSGSLYEVIDQIDDLIANTVPSSLSPFVTDERLLEMKEKIEDYLS
jgi:hypothetical protein